MEKKIGQFGIGSILSSFAVNLNKNLILLGKTENKVDELLSYSFDPKKQLKSLKLMGEPVVILICRKTNHAYVSCLNYSNQQTIVCKIQTKDLSIIQELTLSGLVRNFQLAETHQQLFARSSDQLVSIGTENFKVLKTFDIKTTSECMKYCSGRSRLFISNDHLEIMWIDIGLKITSALFKVQSKYINDIEVAQNEQLVCVGTEKGIEVFSLKDNKRLKSIESVGTNIYSMIDYDIDNVLIVSNDKGEVQSVDLEDHSIKVEFKMCGKEIDQLKLDNDVIFAVTREQYIIKYIAIQDLPFKLNDQELQSSSNPQRKKAQNEFRKKNSEKEENTNFQEHHKNPPAFIRVKKDQNNKNIFVDAHNDKPNKRKNFNQEEKDQKGVEGQKKQEKSKKAKNKGTANTENETEYTVKPSSNTYQKKNESEKKESNFQEKNKKADSKTNQQNNANTDVNDQIKELTKEVEQLRKLLVKREKRIQQLESEVKNLTKSKSTEDKSGNGKKAKNVKPDDQPLYQKKL